MHQILSSLRDRVERFHDRATPWFHRGLNTLQRSGRRLLRRPRSVSEGPSLLPLMIQVLAAFSKVDGEVLEEEIDSSLGFLRYDYPDAVYSELRRHFRQALHEQQDLDAMAKKLANDLGLDRKILLCVQLYDLISKAGLPKAQVEAYYVFMSKLGMAAQAVDIVYQLNAGPEAPDEVNRQGGAALEALVFGPEGETVDVVLPGLDPGERLNVYRHHDLIILKNLTNKQVFVRGRAVLAAGFCRIYPGQRIILGEQVLTYQDLVFYFNAKKNVSLPQVFLKINEDDEVELERSRGRDSCLEVRFGLAVEVRALKMVDAVLNGVRLAAGTIVHAGLDDRIIFHDNSELELSDLRRRARAMGGRFTLKTSKSEYLVSNNPGLLDEDDILLSPGTSGEVLLKIKCDYERKVGQLDVLQADRPILVHDVPVRNSAPLADGDIIRIDAGQVLRCDFSERIIEEHRNIIRSLALEDVRVRFSNGDLGLDGITLAATRGEMVCVMGASGCGKSTLLQVMAGQLPPTAGSILLNNTGLYPNLDSLKGYISHIPQEDAFDENLTIEENLAFAAAVRAPYLSRKDRARRVDGKLIELGLSERRDSVVGSAIKKRLSGGERKRLNIGLDMIGNADIYLFDEPTSGLSSKDSEHVIEIIRGMSHNKIVFVTIHQPSGKLFHMFHKALLLDKGGRLVFYGTPDEMLAYFAAAEHEQQFGVGLAGEPATSQARPEFIFDVLEAPLRDLSGDIIYEENSKSQLVPARRYSPEYWRDKYEAHRLMQDVRQIAVRKEARPEESAPPPIRQTPRVRWRDEWTQFRTLLRRAFMSKMRIRANLLTTIVEAPLLAALIGLVLRYSESGTYDFASAFHIPTYLFLMLVVAMFLGLTNSADDIIRDRAILQRERNLNIRIPYYVVAKFLTLALFAGLQSVLFVLIGNWILEVRGMFGVYFGFTFATALSGLAIGLLISSLVADAKTAVNIVPLILIPQIILGGALIKYEEMNRNLDFFYTLDRWLSRQSESGRRPQSDLEVPLVCQFMPMRWSYEAIVVAQAKENPLTVRQSRLNALIASQIAQVKSDPAAENRLEEAKEALAILSGMEGRSPAAVDRGIRMIDRFLADPSLPARSLRLKGNAVSAERLYVNQKVADLVSTAEMEQKDYSREKAINVFFGPVKTYFGRTWSVEFVNMLVLDLSILGVLYLLHLSLRRQLRLRAV